MIRINLLTVKRRKPIQIPFAAIFTVIGIVVIAVGTSVIAGMIPGFVNVDKYKADLEKIQKEISNAKKVEGEISKYKRDAREIEDRIRRLSQLSGSSLLQWSAAFSDLTNVVPKQTVWITNMRIDTDRRVQLTAYACNENGKDEPKEGGQLTKGIQDFIQGLQQHPNFSEIFLTSATKNKYEQKDVWRFEISCRLRRDIGEESDGGSYE